MNVVMFALDAVRADHLGCYGHERPTSPWIDALAGDGVLFEHHFTPAVPTQPACTTVFSGTHPLTHRIIAQEGRRSPNPKVTWLPLLMRHHGFTTVAIDNLVDQRLWFARGFEYYVNPRGGDAAGRPDRFSERAIEWLEHCRHQPFFLYVRYSNAAAPYSGSDEHVERFYRGDPTKGSGGNSMQAFYAGPHAARWPDSWFDALLQRWGQTDGRRIEDIDFLLAHYDAAIRTIDDGIEAVCAALRRFDLIEDTLVIVYANHGEQLGGAHGIYFDAHGLHDDTLHVPLVLYWPGHLPSAKRVPTMTQHQDLAATVLDAIGQTVPEDVIEGRSLLPLATGASTVSHWNHRLLACECTCQAKWALRTAEYKLIVSREPDFHGHWPIEMYDLLEDGEERMNLAPQVPALTKKLLDMFDNVLGQMLQQRELAHDPIASGQASLAAQLFRRLGRPYPPPRDPNWRGHALPKLRAEPSDQVRA